MTPDTNDWTWVLQHPCPEGGFDSQSFRSEQIPSMLRDNAEQWRELLAGPTEVRRRPRPDRWSPAEYGCHVRDVCRIYLERLELMLHQDAPAFPNWDQDATAVSDRYGEQDPAVVSGELVDAAGRLAGSTR